ncbi:hypothetical protein [Cohnella terricola]|uniref:Galactose mutarotase n=1 Tax=Cohnella terricola TaxID=1289167 RepID=A0A559JQM9_9BACL|nr:hypothetical protein [Cohnella terricola]TVY02184.1 hypothetical protein FPZ45_07015 [Cohnella terricola]
MTYWTKTDREGYEAWISETSKLSVTIIPTLGSKMVSLLNKETGREWLWRSDKPLGNQGYGSAFGDGDESGWDEMFPGINVCAYPDEPWRGRIVPDHGEVWSLPWQAQADNGTLRCNVQGREFPYTLDKAVSFIADDTLRIEYTVTNLSDYPFSFLWAAHPLLRAEAGMKLRVPDGLKTIAMSYSAQTRLGNFGAKHRWPIPDLSLFRTESTRDHGAPIDLSVLEPNEGRYAEKYYFADELAEGWAELCDPVTDEAITFRFPTEQVPYLAVWANYGGYAGHYHFAIEPATGTMDDLAFAMSENRTSVIAPGGMYRWYLETCVR